MKKSTAAANPGEYLSDLSGWQKQIVSDLRAAVLRAEPKLDEVIKWGHLVYSFNGPVLLIRAETERVLFGFWRGQRLVNIHPGLKPGGKYEMATLTFQQGDDVDLSRAEKLTKEATALNERIGDPRKAAKEPERATAMAASHLIDERIRSLGGWRAETLAEVRHLIHEADPDTMEECKWIKPSNPLGVPVWSHAGIVCTGEAYKQVVKLTFAQGASLADPRGLFNSSLEGNTSRHRHPGGRGTRC